MLKQLCDFNKDQIIMARLLGWSISETTKPVNSIPTNSGPTRDHWRLINLQWRLSHLAQNSRRALVADVKYVNAGYMSDYTVHWNLMRPVRVKSTHNGHARQTATWNNGRKLSGLMSPMFLQHMDDWVCVCCLPGRVVAPEYTVRRRRWWNECNIQGNDVS